MSATPDISSQKDIEEYSQIEQLAKRIHELEEKIGEKDLQEPNSLSSLEGVARLVGAVAGAVVALGFVFYVLGYHFVNDYYGSFGLREFEINKPVYLSAGIVFVVAFILPIVIPLVSAVTFRRFFLEVRINLPAFLKFFFSFVFLIVTYLSLDDLLLGILTDGKVPLLQNICMSVFQDCSIYITGHFSMAVFIFSIFSFTFAKYAPGLPLIGLFLLILILGLILVLVSWGEEIYPNINPAFAGGETTRIRVVISTDANVKQFSGIGIEVADFVTEELSLIDQTDDFITVINKSCNAVKLSQALIANIIFIQPIEGSESGLKECHKEPKMNLTP